MRRSLGALIMLTGFAAAVLAALGCLAIFPFGGSTTPDGRVVGVVLIVILIVTANVLVAKGAHLTFPPRRPISGR